MTAHRATILQVAAALFLLGIGVAGFRMGYATFQPRDALVGVMTGLLVGGCGLLAWRRASTSRLGPMLVIVGLLWLPSDWRLATEPVSSLSHLFALGYASVMAHALLTYPSGRAVDRVTRGLVVLGYAAAFVPAALGAFVIAGVLVSRLAMLLTRHPGAARDERLAVAVEGAVFGGVLLAVTHVPFIREGSHVIDLKALLELVLVLSAALLAGLLIRARERSSVADLVLDVGDARGGSLAIELGLLLDDPTLQVGFRLPGADSFTDAGGRRLELPAVGDGRAATFIERDGADVAVLLHRPQLTTDTVLRDAVARAAELAAANARLQAELRAQMANVMASRRRLVAAGDDERAELERRLRQGPERRLATLTGDLRAALTMPSATAVPLTRAIDQLANARTELAELADGLHPRVLDRLGLAGALAEMAARCQVLVVVEVADDVQLAPDGEATIYFVTSEALANVAKHSHATHAGVGLVRAEESVRLTIDDDGAGGADERDGSGLRGLRDRVEAIGGSFELESRPGHGTHLAATIPMAGEVHLVA